MHQIEIPSEISESDYQYWLLCTYGFEKEAEAMVARALQLDTARFWHVPRPGPFARRNEGQAAAGQLLLGIKGEPLTPDVVQGLPGVMGAYAFVGAAAGVPDNSEHAFPALGAFVASLSESFRKASKLTDFHIRAEDSNEHDKLQVAPNPKFRVSIVRDGCHNFQSEQVCAFIGGGVATAMKWPVDMKRYDIEVFGVLHGDVLTLGLSCAKLGDARKGATRSSELPHEKRPWHVADARHMRFSTAALLLELAQVSSGESLLDCCGGVGSIALEAATRIPCLRAVSSDKSEKACEHARQNVIAAESLGLLASGSSVEVRCVRVGDEIAKYFGAGTFDVVVSELPFGLGCKKTIAPELLVSTLSYLLRPSTGRAALISPIGSAEGNLAATFTSAALNQRHSFWQEDVLVRDGNVGGISVRVILVRRGPAVACTWKPDTDTSIGVEYAHLAQSQASFRKASPSCFGSTCLSWRGLYWPFRSG